MHDMGEAEWERLLDQLDNGDCTPFLGAGACAGTLPVGRELSQELARRWDYPYEDDYDLPRVAQYAAMRYGDPVHIKRIVCRELGTVAPPDFEAPLEPHGLLAQFPLPVYLTTNYDDFILRSLQAVGKRPNVALCPWHEDIEHDGESFAGDADGDPGPDRPLIYHLHGSLRSPMSIVLAEDDYLEFLTNLVTGAEDGRQMLPTPVLEALTRRSLLFIGYSLQDWTFRVLFRGLLRTIPTINRRRHVSVQLTPSFAGGRTDVAEVQRQLARYYEHWRISIFWGTTEEFCRELRSRMGAV